MVDYQVYLLTVFYGIHRIAIVNVHNKDIYVEVLGTDEVYPKLLNDALIYCISISNIMVGNRDKIVDMVRKN